MNCVADDASSTPAGDRGPGRTNGNAVTNPRIRVYSNRRLKVLSPALRNCFILLHPVLHREGTSVFEAIDNEHQSSCARIGSPTGCSNPMTRLSTIAARPGTNSSTGRGGSCPSVCAIGLTSSDLADGINRTHCAPKNRAMQYKTLINGRFATGRLIHQRQARRGSCALNVAHSRPEAPIGIRGC